MTGEIALGEIMECAPALGPPAAEPDLERITADVIVQLKSVFDPEIPVDIYELGLIYKVEFNEGVVDIEMTLTAPACPVAGEMPSWVQEAVAKVEGVESVRVNLVFEPPWTSSMMSDEAKLELNLL